MGNNLHIWKRGFENLYLRIDDRFEGLIDADIYGTGGRCFDRTLYGTVATTGQQEKCRP
jgi:hypothetical protein